MDPIHRKLHQRISTEEAVLSALSVGSRRTANVLWSMPAAVFSLALAVRLLYNLTVARAYFAVYDAAQYERIALHLLSQHCFCDYSYIPTIERGPVWPVTIAAVYFLFGPQNQYARFLLSCVGSGTCLLLYYFARDLFQARRYGLLAGGIGALYPGLFIYDGWLYSESLYTFLFLLYVYALYRFQRTMQRRWIMISGMALGLALLTRTNEIIAVGMLASWAFIIGYSAIVPKRTALFAGMYIALIAVVIILPWSVRNYVVNHKIVLTATGGDIVLAGAYNDAVFTTPMLGNVGMWVTPQLIRPPVVYRSPCLGACSDIWGERPELREAAVRWIITHPARLPELWLLHFWNIWVPGVPDGVLPFDQPGASAHLSSYLVRLMVRRIPTLIILLAGCGMIVLWRTKWRDLLPIVLAIGWTVVQCILLYGSIRFRAPIEPMLVLLATGSLSWGWTVISGRWKSCLSELSARDSRNTDSHTLLDQR